jgi:hypothetical protein
VSIVTCLQLPLVYKEEHASPRGTHSTPNIIMVIAEFATGADVARAYIECMSNKDMETFKALMLPDAKYQLLPRSLKRPANGPEGVAALFEAFYKLIPDLHVRIFPISLS